jgi:diguanylate cyclase (GGDEF)-like protein
MLTPHELEQLGDNALFRDVELEGLLPVLDDCLLSTVHGGEKLLEINQQNNSLYLILEGELHVYLNPHDLAQHAVLGAGSCAGELSLVDGGRASAMVLAARDTRVLAMPHRHVWALVDGHNPIARNLLCILAGRVRSNNLMRVTSSEHSLEFDIAANIDALTGLHNREWMEDSFTRMLQRCRRSAESACLMLADIDGFKLLNKTNGHAAGDSVLKGVARLMAENLRPHDLLVYLGVDKFAVLLPATSSETALRISGRLREAIAGFTPGEWAENSIAVRALAKNEVRVTLSMGIASMQPGDELDSMLSRAHVALYRAKTGGANSVQMEE